MKRNYVIFVAFIFAVYKASADEENIFNKVIQTKNGPVQGIVQQSRNPAVKYVSFLGLRYADPPPRFEPAKPLTEKWTSPKLANTAGSICIQSIPGGSDDCLFLNVHVPVSALENPSKLLPVMFWVHGGGFSVGDGATSGAKYLMENDDVIIVTTNYRLHVLGFISMEDDTTFTANNGLRDVVQALKWVQENIASFQGNPEKVTIFGISAGSAACHFLLMSPLTKGLYQAAILQSGAFSFWSYASNPKKDAMLLAEALKCPNAVEPAEIRKCLEGKSAEEIVNGQFMVEPRWPPYNPITRFVPTAKEPQKNAFFAGEPSSFFTFHDEKPHYPNNVPVIIGITRDEGSLLYTAFLLAREGLLEQLNTDWKALAPKTFAYDRFVPEDKWDLVSENIRKYYFDKKQITKDNLDPLIELYTDSLMRLPVMQAAVDMASSGMSVYPYVFSFVGEFTGFEGFGIPTIPDKACHGCDIRIFLNYALSDRELTPDSDDEQLSKSIIKLWINFAKNGVPGTVWGNDSSLNWKPIATKRSQNPTTFPTFDVLEIDKTPRVLDSYDMRDVLSFWRTLLMEAVEKGKSQKTEL